MPTVLIVGAGVGGLTLALELHSHGISCRIFEAADHQDLSGAGINLQDYAVQRLYRLGLADMLSERAESPLVSAFAGSDGTIQLRVPLGIVAMSHSPQYSIHRAALLDILKSAVSDRIGPDTIEYGQRLTSFRQGGEQVVACFDSQMLVSGDFLVGCDGVHSTVCRQFFAGGADLRPAGVSIWRGVAEGPFVAEPRTVVRCGRIETGKLVVYPMRAPDDPARTVTNWVAELKDAAYEHPEAANRCRPVPAFLSSWRFHWLDVPRLVAQSPQILSFPMVDRDPLPRWTHGRVTLLGDAAHPMYPVGSNGASQAIVDASVLAECLDTDAMGGMKRYEERRRPATGRLVLEERRGGPDVVLDAIHAGRGAAAEACAVEARLGSMLASYRDAVPSH